ncbi:MAG: phosphate signaling complex protein PhoU [Xanthomonadales bacterium]|nr:phosphate signaling complex protein PhoU [Gammaproteobacteria bacterium]MBT8053103.1 phosphate signaling complex protein PhoU [Gammaproteobacteria bacterium]NND56245.1 phosphate signaling complex protein PhoU [Xanthomonadales bacterium]NNK52320.1 phosphate signaling complex protein PhoU [Xanthomonadales bacterium]NNL94008.1 phosphate signaling complex protein PhoU [Xanthomonadales bacterium]
METIGTSHTVHRFDYELNEIAKLVDKMGALAVEQLRRAVKSLKKEDPTRAHKVINRDRKLNDLDVEADEKIIQLIAKRAPMASDLRQIITLGKVVTDLERTGDEARKIAKLCVRIYESDHHIPSEHILRDIYSMSKYVNQMLKLAMDAFSNLNVQQAFGVLLMDEELEEQFDATLRHLSTFVMQDSRNVGHFVDIVLGIRALERFGGHAKNIAGHVIFLATAHDVRHLDADEIQSLLNIEDSP